MADLRTDIGGMTKYLPIVASGVMFICWLMTYLLLTEQFNYVKDKDLQFEIQKARLEQLEEKVDSTNAVLKNININLYRISKSTQWMR